MHAANPYSFRWQFARNERNKDSGESQQSKKKLKIFNQNQIDIHQEQTHKMGHMQKSDSQLDSTTWNTIKRKQ